MQGFGRYTIMTKLDLEYGKVYMLYYQGEYQYDLKHGQGYFIEY